uniref:Interferon/interleukin receptor domain-containing protein n=1 Tax=Neogobius melanostomus TaxID=47308 RepID=A0A8C6TJU6_9GOBI
MGNMSPLCRCFVATVTMCVTAVIGPPNVSLVSSGADMEVIVRAPEFHISTMAKVYTETQYKISYWPQGRQDRAVHLLVQQDRVALVDLEPWTEYCVQARVLVHSVRNSNPTVASEPVCESTKDSKETPWLPAVLTFFAVAIVVTLVVISVVYRKRICHFLCPQDPLPQHLSEYLHSLPHLMPKTEVYHPLHVVPHQCPEEPTLPDKS